MRVQLCLGISRNGNGKVLPDPKACFRMAEALDITRAFLTSIEQGLTEAERSGQPYREIPNDAWQGVLLMVLVNSRRVGLLNESAELRRHLEDAWKAHIVDLDDETHASILKALAGFKTLAAAFERTC